MAGETPALPGLVLSTRAAQFPALSAPHGSPRHHRPSRLRPDRCRLWRRVVEAPRQRGRRGAVGRFKTGEALASNAITLSTIFAVASVAFWLHAVEWF